MLTKTQKKKIIDELADKIKRQKILIFTNIAGVKVGGIQKLRRELKKEEVEYKVVKKTLINLALKQAKQEVDTSSFTGSSALAFGYQEPVLPAKIIYNFSKEHPNLKILGGLMENRFLTPEEVIELAKIPSKQELIAKLIGSIQAPVSGLVNVLEGNLRNLLLIFKQIKI